MLKRRTLFVIALIFSFSMILSSCNSNRDEMFQLTIINPQTRVQVGDNVTYTAQLTNNTNKKVTIYHGYPLINLYIRHVDDTTEEGIGSVRIESIVEPHEILERTLNIEAVEAGEYILRAFSRFEIDGNDCLLECDDVRVTIVE